jgi:hypothetical protein
MHINLPNGDKLVPDAEFLKIAGDVTARTGNDWDRLGCPFIIIGGRKYRPLNEALGWLTTRIERKNPPRKEPRVSRLLGRSSAPVTLPTGPPDAS